MPPAKKRATKKAARSGATKKATTKKTAPKRRVATAAASTKTVKRATTKKAAGKRVANSKAANKKAANKKAAHPATPSARDIAAARAPATRAERGTIIIVPDTSVLVDGRLTLRIQEGDLHGARIVIPLAAMAELEAQANRGRETGFAGLDEVGKLQELAATADCSISFAGVRPTDAAVERASDGGVDALIRDVAVATGGTLFTSDRIQAHVARAMALPVEWVRPDAQGDEEVGFEDLAIMTFFEPDIMSVHLKQDVVPMVKRGTPGNMRLEKVSTQPMQLRELTRMRRDIIEAAKRDANSFIEIERHGATVVQLRNMRIAIAQPPFADGVEITAVRPVAQLTLDEYQLRDELTSRLSDYRRGVFVSGPPGSGKSTFAAAIAEFLRGQDKAIIKTMESPRDLQVSDAITQYAPLDHDMALTGEVLLLVRPDFVIYDEVRKTHDFEIFADMRLAGVGLIGVTHANEAIDAVQRLIGRVELGMIPQVVDTVIHIQDGKVDQVLELSFTVKVPAGMADADLARPVIEIKDFLEGGVTHELYTFGEQVVVMPVGKAGAGAGGREVSGRDKLASDQLRHVLRRYVAGPLEVEVDGNRATVFVQQSEIGMLVGRGGSNVKSLEQAVGMKLTLKPLEERRQEVRQKRAVDDGQPRYHEVVPELRKTKKSIVLLVQRNFAGQAAKVVVDDMVVADATVGMRGDIRINRDTEAGEYVQDALAHGDIIRVRL